MCRAPLLPILAFLFLLLPALCLLPSSCPAQSKRLELVPEKGPLAGKPVYTNSFALIIGVDAYPNLPKDKQLRFAKKDARDLREILIRSYGFLSDNIILLLDKDATKTNIETALAALAEERVQPTDRILVYFSGHGQTVKLQDGGEMGFLIPYDAKVDLSHPGNRGGYLATCLRMDSLWGYLEASAARHRLLIADACFGGMLVRSKALSPERPNETLLAGLLTRPALQAMTAGRSDEEAREDPKLGHSAYTYKLLEELRAQAATAGSVFLASALASSLKTSVANLTEGKQTPQFGNYRGTEGDFVFVSTDPRSVPAEVSGLPEGSGEAVSDRVKAVRLVDAGNALYDQRKYDEAEKSYKQAIEFDPTNSMAYYGMGKIYGQKKDFAVAEKSYKKAIEINPKNSMAYNGLGFLYATFKKDYTEAVRLWNHALELDPDNAGAIYNLGYLHYIRYEYAEAEPLIRKAMELNPKNSFYVNGLGCVYEGKEKFAEAEKWFRKAIELDSESNLAHANLARALLRQGKRDEALTEAKRAKELGLKEHSVFDELGL